MRNNRVGSRRERLQKKRSRRRQRISVIVGVPLLLAAFSLGAIKSADSAAQPVYQCFRYDSPNVARSSSRLVQYSPLPSAICRTDLGDKILNVTTGEDVTPTTTTTQPPTTTAATTTTVPQSGSYRDAVMADAPVAYWRFASTASETGSHNGTLRGSPAPLLNQPGPFSGSQSIRFDGVLRDNATTGGFLANSLGRLSGTAWSNGFTLEAWAKTTTNGPEQHVMTWSNSAGDAGPGTLFDDPDDKWKFRDGNVSTSMNGTTTINAWHHVVASVNASGNGTLYVDGQPVKTWSSGVDPTTSNGLFTVGADYDSHDCPCPHVDTPFNGWIAETAVYNKALTATRVQAHYAARNSGTTTTTTTVPPTTTTTVGGTCSGVALTGGQSQVSSAPTGTTFCVTGTHNWTLTPKAGQKFIGPAIFDGQGTTSHAFVATAPNVVLQNLTIRNYDPDGGPQDAAIHIDDSDSVKNAASGWQLRNLDVSGSTADGSGSGTNWTFIGGRYHDNRIGGIMGAMGNGVTLDGVEIDHNNFTNSTYTTRNWSCGDEAGGIKWVTNDLTIKNSYVHHNACKGIWADLSAERSIITNNRVYDNWDEGIFFEISSTATITGNDVRRNGLRNYNGNCSNFGWGGGITTSNSGRTEAAGNGTVDIGGNSLVDNCNSITVVDISGRDEGVCPCDAANTLVHDNIISGGGPSGAWTDRGTNLSAQNIVFTRNTFSNGAVYCGLDC